MIAALTSLALCACGAFATGTGPTGPSPSSSPSTGPGQGFDVSVTEKDRSVTIRAGQKLEAVLHAGPGLSLWSGVRSSDTSILVPIADARAAAVRGVTLAGFEAMAPGKAQITATAGALCSPGQACPMYAVLLSIDVTVISG